MPSSPSARSSRPSGTTVAIAAGVLVAALLLGFASYTATRPQSPSKSGPAAEVSAEPGAGTYPELVKLARRDAGDPLAMGRADAPS